jgi:transposase
VDDALSRRLLPDSLWALVRPLLPVARSRPQGGGRARADDRAVCTAIVFVVISGCPWHRLPPSFGVAVPTAHRRFTEWTRAGLWQAALDAVVARGQDDEDLEWSIAVLDAALARARAGRRHAAATPAGPARNGDSPHPAKREIE